MKPGNHKVELDFHPQSVRTTETVAYIGYVLLLFVILFGLYMTWRRRDGKATSE